MMSLFKKIMIWVGSIVGAIVLLIALAFYFTSALVKPVYAQMDAIRHGDIVKAYSYTSQDFQKVTSLTAFKQLVEDFPAIANNKDITVTRRELNNGLGLVDATLTSDTGGTIQIKYQLVKENGEWKISYLEVPATGISISKSPNNFNEKALQ
ncbi:MAG: DUF4864 domain-containing protein [Gammaproteobacteria bacterium]